MVTSDGFKHTDSKEMIGWLIDNYPELVPSTHSESIKRLVDDFYSFPARALVMLKDDSKDAFPNIAAEVLEQTGITEPHRRQLEIKSVL